MPRRARAAMAALAMLAASLATPLTTPAAAADDRAFLPAVQLLDDSGSALSGGSWAFRSCARAQDDAPWECVDSGSLGPLPPIGWTDALSHLLAVNGGTGADLGAGARHELTIWMTEPPAGYQADPTPRTWTLICDLWHPGDRDSASCQSTGLIPGLDTGGRPLPAQQNPAFTLVARPIPTVPVLHTTLPSVAYRDGAGQDVPGGALTGWSCVRPSGIGDWSCTDLSPLGLDPSHPSALIDAVAADLPTTSTVPAQLPGVHRLSLGLLAPTGQAPPAPDRHTVEYACGAWRIIDVAGDTAADVQAAAAADCQDHVLVDNTLVWSAPTHTGPSQTAEPTASATGPTDLQGRSGALGTSTDAASSTATGTQASTATGTLEASGTASDPASGAASTLPSGTAASSASAGAAPAATASASTTATGAATQPPNRSRLSSTGAEVLPTVAIGLSLMVAGLGLIVAAARARRRALARTRG